MIKDGVALPELLAEVLKHLLGDNMLSDIHRCLFVNRLFYERAKSILYDSLRFRPYGNSSTSQDDKLWLQLFHNRSLFSHTKNLGIQIHNTSRDLGAAHGSLPSPFGDRVEFLLRHALNLRHVNLLIVHWSKEHQVMIDVLEKLRKAPTNPEVSLHLFYPELHSIMIEGVRRMLLRVCQKPKIVTLTLRICYSRQWFGICS
jgi:hypothetical protein